MQVVKFKYYDEFHCIGPDCPETCCQQWDIFFGKREYLNFKNAHVSPKLKSAIENAFVRIKGKDPLGREVDDKHNNYAMIKMNENGKCPLLDSDGLCMMQKELGEHALGFVCTVFPRLLAVVGDEALICACNTTCPYVIELLMSHPEGLEIVEEEYDRKNENINKGFLSSVGTPKDWEGYPYYWIIKTAQIDILQNRNFTIPERMLVLGFFCQKAEEYIKNKQGKKIQELANMLLDNAACKKIADSLKAPQTDEDCAAKSINTFAKMAAFVHKGDYSDAMSGYFETAEKSIDLEIEEIENGKINFMFDMKKYLNSLETYRKIESERPYIIENLLVNTVFTQAPNEGIWMNFFTIAVFYNLLKICVPAFLPENFTDRDLALALTHSSKMLLNSHLAVNKATFDYIMHQSFDLPHVVFLIS